MDISEIARHLGKLGGEATKASKDKDYYRRIGQQGLDKRYASKRLPTCRQSPYAPTICSTHRRTLEECQSTFK